MKRFFITSSGTDIGKTFIAAALAKQLSEEGHQVQVLKPVMSGYTAEDSDAHTLLEALGKTPSEADIEHMSCYRFAAAISPDIAAAREGKSIDFKTLCDFCDTVKEGADVQLIEGVGGVMVPLTDEHTVLDWVAAIDTKAVLVVGSYLGSLSHTLTAMEVLKSRGVEVALVVVIESDETDTTLDETLNTLSRFIAAPILPVERIKNTKKPWKKVPYIANHLV
jgi:dethiobiotin synthetase